MGKVAAIEQTNKVNYFAQMGSTHSNSERDSESDSERDSEPAPHSDQDPAKALLPTLKDENKKNLKLKLKRPNKKRRAKAKAKYEKQFRQIEGHLFDGTA